MKRTFPFVFALSLVFLVACAANIEIKHENDEMQTSDQYVDTTWREQDEILQSLSVDYHYSLNQSILVDNLIWNYWNYRINYRTPHRISLSAFDSDFPVEFLRSMDTDRMYSIHRTDNGGFFYSFFVSPNGDLSQGVWLSHTIFVMKSLAHSDFAGIEIGSIITDVEAVDPVVTYHRNHALRVESFLDVNRFASFHLLTDGLLVVSYQMQNQSFYVSAMYFFPDFRLIEETSFGEIFFDYSILPQDFPQ